MKPRIDLEAVAALLHQGWMDYQRSKGVVFGPQRTPTTHPHLIPWHELDNDSQNQDRFIASVILRDWAQKKLSSTELPEAIHDAWMEYSRLQGKEHPHALPYHEAHPHGGDDHVFQANLVSDYLLSKRDSNAG